MRVVCVRPALQPGTKISRTNTPTVIGRMVDVAGEGMVPAPLTYGLVARILSQNHRRGSSSRCLSYCFHSNTRPFRLTGVMRAGQEEHFLFSPSHFQFVAVI